MVRNVCDGINCRVVRLLSDHFLLRHGDVGSGSILVRDLNMDSIDLVEVVLALNEEFNIELSEVEVGGWETVGDIFHSVIGVIDREMQYQFM